MSDQDVNREIDLLRRVIWSLEIEVSMHYNRARVWCEKYVVYCARSIHPWHYAHPGRSSSILSDKALRQKDEDESH